MEQLERIRTMEEKLNRSLEAIRALDGALDAYAAALEDIQELALYLSDDTWKEDYDAWEAGALPAETRCGVLSQDGIYNMLDDDQALALKLTDTLAAVLRARG